MNVAYDVETFRLTVGCAQLHVDTFQLTKISVHAKVTQVLHFWSSLPYELSRKAY